LTNTKELVKGAVERLSAAMAAGHSEQLQAYLRAMRNFRRYSATNVLLIAKQRSTATHVAGFHAWRKLGRWVRKGECGIRILAPVMHRRQSGQADDDADDRIAGFRSVYVFDISQTDGEPLPQLACAQGDPGMAIERLHAFATAKGIAIVYADLDLAEGVSTGGRIVLKRSLSSAQTCSVLAHELAHEMLHRHNPKLDRRTKELEAEAVAFAVCEAIGLDSTLASSDYVQLYGAKSTDVLDSLSRIQDAASVLIDAVEDECEAVSETGTSRSAAKVAA